MRVKRLLKNQLGRYAVWVGMQMSRFTRVHLKRRQAVAVPAVVHLAAVMAMALVIGAIPLMAMQAAGKATVGARASSMEGHNPILLAQAVTPVPPPTQRTDAESSYDEDPTAIPESNGRTLLIVLSVVGMVILVAVMIFRRNKGRKLEIE